MVAKWNHANRTLEVVPPDQAKTGFVDAWTSGKAEKSARTTFATSELLWQALTAKRWGILKTFGGVGPVSIRETARRLGRDVRAAHTDVTALLNAGWLVHADGGGIVFPFEAAKVEFMLKAA